MPDELEPALRIGDAERDRAVSRLRDAVVEGRLTLEEFSDRVQGAQLARTESDLTPLLADLPAPVVTATATPAGEPVRHRVICSRLSRGGRWELPQRSAFRCVCGTIDLDLRQATLHGELVELDIANWFGTVTLIVPEGIALSVEGGGPFASQVIDPPGSPPLPDAPRLRVRLSGPCGTVYVRSQPKRGLLDRVAP